jgi:hypothetical protein
MMERVSNPGLLRCREARGFPPIAMSTIVALMPLLVLPVSSCEDKGSDPSGLGQDTTSHDFAWTIQVLGDGAGSVLYDVAIINDTLAYAVGEAYVRDSSGQIDPTPYGVAVWNGFAWELKRLFYDGNNVIAPIRGVYAFGPNDVWLAAGSIFHWNGVGAQAELRFSRLTLPDPNATVEKLWGSSTSQLYGIGHVGTLVQYANGTWQRIESGTTLSIRDIWGATDPRTGQATILAVASGSSPNEGKKLLHIEGTTVAALPDSGLAWSLSGLWFIIGQRYYIVGDGIYYAESPAPERWLGGTNQVTAFYTTRVRGNASNDVIICGAFGESLHWNGLSWRSYRPQTIITNGAWGSVAIKGNLTMAVGHDGQQAIAAIGRR